MSTVETNPNPTSVRIRKLKDFDQDNNFNMNNSGNGGGGHLVKKRNRHSGDFMVWQQLQQPHTQISSSKMLNRQSGDWFQFNYQQQTSLSPNGQPTPTQQPQSYHKPSTNASGGNRVVWDNSRLVQRTVGFSTQNENENLLGGGRGVASDFVGRSMETLDRRIPPTLRTAAGLNNNNQQLNSNFILQQEDQSKKEQKRLKQQYRKSCDVAQLQNKSQAKKINKSIDAMLNNFKRSYPDLREAASEFSMYGADASNNNNEDDEDELYGADYDLDDGVETQVSTVVAQASMVSGSNLASGSAIRKGLLWQQREKMFSRWKERFFILTTDYLQCFKKSTSRISEMGGFIFKLRLSEIEDVELIDKRGYLTIGLSFARDGRILLRRTEGIREWFDAIKESVISTKERKGMMKSTKEFWSKRQFSDANPTSSSGQLLSDQWLLTGKQRATGHHRSIFSNIGNPSSTPHGILKTTDYGFIDTPIPGPNNINNPPKSPSQLKVRQQLLNGGYHKSKHSEKKSKSEVNVRMVTTTDYGAIDGPGASASNSNGVTFAPGKPLVVRTGRDGGLRETSSVIGGKISSAASAVMLSGDYTKKSKRQSSNSRGIKDSVSHKSQDSGIDSIEKPGRDALLNGGKLPQQNSPITSSGASSNGGTSSSSGRGSNSSNGRSANLAEASKRYSEYLNDMTEAFTSFAGFPTSSGSNGNHQNGGNSDLSSSSGNNGVTVVRSRKDQRPTSMLIVPSSTSEVNIEINGESNNLNHNSSRNVHYVDSHIQKKTPQVTKL